MKPFCYTTPNLKLSTSEAAAIARRKSLTTADIRYTKLINAYDKILDNYLDTMTSASMGLVLQSKIPLTTKNHPEKVFDETDQDSKYKMLVLEKYLLSIEEVQSGNEVVKRAISNLPEHKVHVLKDWCRKNSNSPCKLMLFLVPAFRLLIVP